MTATTATPTGERATGSRVVVRAPTARTLNPRRYRVRQRALEITLAWLTPIALVLLWELSSRRGWIDPRFFPAPSSIWDTGVDLVRNGELQDDIVVTFRRVLIGFALGSGLGIVFGALLGAIPLLRAAFEPLMYALWTVPKLALLPLLLLIFGLGERPMIVLIILNCVFIAMIPTMGAIDAVDPGHSEVARSVHATNLQRFRTVLWPAALPQIFIGLRLAATASVLTVIAAEFVQGRDGLGFLIWNSWTLYLAEPMYVGIVCVSVLGTAFALLVGAIGRRISPWFEHE